ncbi:hypothetical protein POM88_033366 [Heracleum sosnowskyi]|uniref:Uncharacterized protein n=1 Tax=Heracleum sosnowskyi TaxID=360622 RepID=A0AAD8I3D5_9APIA|nr:hypothetical protein POM88_033366 [Heracleum sosnowskyi]
MTHYSHILLRCNMDNTGLQIVLEAFAFKSDIYLLLLFERASGDDLQRHPLELIAKLTMRLMLPVSLTNLSPNVQNTTDFLTGILKLLLIIVLNTGHIPFGHKNTVLNMSMIELLRAAVAQDKKYVALDDGRGLSPGVFGFYNYGDVMYWPMFIVADVMYWPMFIVSSLSYKSGDNLRIIKLALALGMEQQKRCFQGFALSTFLNVHFVEHWMKCSGKYQSNNPMIKPLRLRLRRQVYFGVLTLLDAASSEGMKADEEQDGDNA